MINGENHTDETECEDWPCSNIYTRCNLFWNCPRGQDEQNCSKALCSFPAHPCISPDNGTFGCLPVERMENGVIDCLGGSDELRQCLEMEAISNTNGRYHCFNENRCLESYQICDKRKDCLSDDDEAFCENTNAEKCNSLIFINRSNVETALCQLQSLKKIDFSLQTSPIYPRQQQRMIDSLSNRQLEVHSVPMVNAIDDLSWTWRCNRGLYVRVRVEENSFSGRCFCPPAYYGDFCEYQNDRVSLSLKLTTNNRHGIYVIVVSLIEEDAKQRINSYDQIYYLPKEEQCPYNYNMYLLYLNRSKNASKKYSVHIDAFDKISLTYVASWYFPVPFLFLPVNRLSVQLFVPTRQVHYLNKCPLPCQNGQCLRYFNVDKFFCRCHSGWSGAFCQIRSNCADCSPQSVCVGSIRNRSICVCPLHNYGPRCFLSRSCRSNACLNNGLCLVTEKTEIHNDYVCVCPEPFIGHNCQVKLPYKLELSLRNLEISKHISVCYISVSNNQVSLIECRRERLKMFQTRIDLHHIGYFNILLVQMNENFYLAAIQLIGQGNFASSISSKERCLTIDEVSKGEILRMPAIRRVKSYHQICQTHLNLWCFTDESYMCLCTRERHANCFHFKVEELRTCPYNYHCLNEGTCLQEDMACPRVTVCICKDCFFGNRCQFHAQGIGLTLDDILRYEIRPNVTWREQPVAIKVSATLTMIMFGLGLINSVLSLLIFSNPSCLKVGCGIYLLASSITSFLTLSTLTLKYWFLILTQMKINPNRSILYVECVLIESFLKFFLYYDNWLNACVAIERSITVFQGIHFKPKKSKFLAKCLVCILPFLILGTILHEFLYRNLFDDREEERIWCVTYYSNFIQLYNTIILFFHFLGPFVANFFSALFIICRTSSQRATIRTGQSYQQHLSTQFNQHKHLIISPILLVILASPRLFISLLSSCAQISHNPWLYMSGYFISFIPSVLSFIVFVLPSETYKQQFKQSLRSLHQRIHR